MDVRPSHAESTSQFSDMDFSNLGGLGNNMIVERNDKFVICKIVVSFYQTFITFL